MDRHPLSSPEVFEGKFAIVNVILEIKNSCGDIEFFIQQNMNCEGLKAVKKGIPLKNSPGDISIDLFFENDFFEKNLIQVNQIKERLLLISEDFFSIKNIREVASVYPMTNH